MVKMTEGSFILLFGRAEPFQRPAGEQDDTGGAHDQVGQHFQQIDKFSTHSKTAGEEIAISDKGLE